MLRGCLFYVICYSNRFHSFILKLCIYMIFHTLKMCNRDAGPEQFNAFGANEKKIKDSCSRPYLSKVGHTSGRCTKLSEISSKKICPMDRCTSRLQAEHFRRIVRRIRLAGLKDMRTN